MKEDYGLIKIVNEYLAISNAKQFNLYSDWSTSWSYLTRIINWVLISWSFVLLKKSILAK